MTGGGGRSLLWSRGPRRAFLGSGGEGCDADLKDGHPGGIDTHPRQHCLDIGIRRVVTEDRGSKFFGVAKVAPAGAEVMRGRSRGVDDIDVISTTFI
ncbi:hypothetical protein [Amycolatopsis alkalitolerans]|uniref:Uncharacterized protein n=1 Tax=Amycolatopsis alkalitolerans TaxID=2547244 RepID=A0A5C4M6G9_9PSEU|nr:hypothetical protein [Amycolatopsis alkalitolerans]TNC28443.1 hypothetical protein FG385_03955 [Amycolatopsis alkalitolerans]